MLLLLLGITFACVVVSLECSLFDLLVLLFWMLVLLLTSMGILLWAAVVCCRLPLADVNSVDLYDSCLNSLVSCIVYVLLIVLLCSVLLVFDCWYYGFGLITFILPRFVLIIVIVVGLGGFWYCGVVGVCLG